MIAAIHAIDPSLVLVGLAGSPLLGWAQAAACAPWPRPLPTAPTRRKARWSRGASRAPCCTTRTRWRRACCACRPRAVDSHRRQHGAHRGRIRSACMATAPAQSQMAREVRALLERSGVTVQSFVDAVPRRRCDDALSAGQPRCLAGRTRRSAETLALLASLQAEPVDGIEEMVPAARTLLVRFRPEKLSRGNAGRRIGTRSLTARIEPVRQRWSRSPSTTTVKTSTRSRRCCRPLARGGDPPSHGKRVHRRLHRLCAGLRLPDRRRSGPERAAPPEPAHEHPGRRRGAGGRLSAASIRRPARAAGRSSA